LGERGQSKGLNQTNRTERMKGRREGSARDGVATVNTVRRKGASRN